MKKRDHYYRFSKYLTNRFGEKVLKIPLDLGFGCPNRDGTLSESGCIYCDDQGSGTGLGTNLSLSDQIATQLSKLKRKGFNKFIGYFQSFTNTYCSPEVLEKNLQILLHYPEIVLVYLGTRPDMFSKEHLKVIHTFSKKKEIGIEFGLQSALDETLNRINRHHSFSDFERAVALTKSAGIFTTAHIIIGLPGEAVEDEVFTARQLTRLQINSVKIHQLYIVSGTTLHQMFTRGEFQPLTFSEAIDRTISVLQNLDKDIIIQRLTGDPKPGQLIAPNWILNKNKFLNEINKLMSERRVYQGDLC